MHATETATPSTPAQRRAWLSPLTGLSFVVIGLTGILMFFRVRLPGMTMLHELGGLLFILAAAWHLKLNWRPLLAYCGKKRGRLALGAGALLLGLFLVLGLGHDEEHRRQRGHQVDPCEAGVHEQP